MSRLLNPGFIEDQQPDPFQNLLQQALMPPQQQQQVAVPTMSPMENRGRDNKWVWDVLGAVGAGLASKSPAVTAQMFQQMSQQREQNRQQSASANATAQWLKARGREDLIPLVEAGMAAEALKMATQRQDTPASVQEYEYAKQNGFGGSFQDWLSTSRQQQAGPETLGLNPIMATGPDGKPMMFQPGNRGSLKQMQFPDGVTPLSPYDTSLQKSLGSETGKAKAGALSQMPAALAKVEAIEGQVDALLNHPKFDSMVGPLDAWRPNVSGGARDWQSRFDQLTGQAFLAARQELKGGGAITDFEGQKAEMALNRANQATDEASFRQAMLEFKQAIRRGYEILAEQAGGGSGGAQRPMDPGKTYRYNPQTGQIEQ